MIIILFIYFKKLEKVADHFQLAPSMRFLNNSNKEEGLNENSYASDDSFRWSFSVS